MPPSSKNQCLPVFFSIRRASPLMLADPNQLKLAGLILNFTMQSCTRMGGSSGARLIHEHLHTKTPAHFFGDGVVVLVLGERHDLLGHIPNSRPQQRKKIYHRCCNFLNREFTAYTSTTSQPSPPLSKLSFHLFKHVFNPSYSRSPPH